MVFKDKHLGTETLPRSRKRRAGLDKTEEEPSRNQLSSFQLRYTTVSAYFLCLCLHLGSCNEGAECLSHRFALVSCIPNLVYS